jgi:hypothetical protein
VESTAANVIGWSGSGFKSQVSGQSFRKMQDANRIETLPFVAR